jgi:hypothetical protein
MKTVLALRRLLGILFLTLAMPMRSLAADIPKLKTLFQASSQTADYIMVIDTSLSMKEFWPVVIGGITEFSNALPDGDHVAVVFFNREASNTLILPRTINSKSKSDLRLELGKLGVPSGEEAKKTDLGKGLRLVLQESARPEANRLQFIFLFSDFEHDPATDSPYRSRDPNDPAWKELATQMKRVAANKSIQDFALMLPIGSHLGRDLPLVESVLGQPEVIPINTPETLQEWFNRRRAEIERDKMRMLVADDIGKGWNFEVLPDLFGNTVLVRSRLEKLPMAVAIQSCSAAGMVAQANIAPVALVEPKQNLAIIRLKEKGILSWPFWLVMPRRTATCSLGLSGNVEFQPSEEIGPALQLEVRRPIIAGEAIEIQIVRGAPLWIQAVVALLLALLLAALWRVWLKPAPNPSRGLFSRVLLHGGAYNEGIDIPQGNKLGLVIGNTDESTVKSKLGPPLFAFRLLGLKPKFPRLRPPRGIYAYAVRGTIYYRGRQYDAKKRRWVDQDAPLPQSEKKAIPIDFGTKLSVKREGDVILIEMKR